MSKLYSNASQFTYKIPKFRGISENTDGDAKLKNGEASKMLNYRVTDSGGLQVRPGFEGYFSLVYEDEELEDMGQVDGIYEGNAKGHRVVIAHDNNVDRFTMRFRLPNGAWSTPISTGFLNASSARFFFFGNELYAMSTTQYLKWDGDVDAPEFYEVEGYVPTIVIAASPDGTGTLYEQINKLTTSRRVRYNADGTAKKYFMPEGGHVEITDVVVNGASKELTTDYTFTQGNQYGVHACVEFVTAPAEGINNIEIEYRTSSDQEFRSSVGDIASGSVKFAPDGTRVTAVTQVRALNAPATRWEELTANTDYTVDGNTLTLANPENWSIVKVYYTIGTYRDEVIGMRYAEIYNGAQDTRIFLYGDGSNTALYSGLDENGKATAEYFPDLNEMEIGDKSTPITALIRHRNRLLAFKPHEAYSVYYNPVSLADSTLIAGFYVSNINRDVGCSVMGGAVQVENRIRTIDYNAIWEWKSTNTSGNITSDARNADRVSDRVCDTVGEFDLSQAVMFYDIYKHEFYVADGSGKCLVQNTEADAWYVYDNMAAKSISMIGQDVVFGNSRGRVFRLNTSAAVDAENTLNGVVGARNIKAEWESGQLDFDKPHIRKYTPTVWISAAPELGSAVTAAISTDNGIATSISIDFKETDGVPRTRKARLKARRFTYYKLKLMQDEATAHAIIMSAVISANYDTPVKR